MSKNAGMSAMTRAFVVLGLLLGVILVPTQNSAQAAPQFNVIGFYHGTYDSGHIAFVREANPWFTQAAAQNNFSYTASNNWDLLNNISPQQYQVVMFLDDQPASGSQRAGFQRYMENGGGFFGWHVSAFTQNASQWPWYHNTFLGSGNFRNNTWFPTAATLQTDNRTHPATKRLPATFRSSVSEWYSWNGGLRNNPNITVLASVHPSSFPLGTDPNQSWYSGDYPIMWTNKNFKMVYANFGHNSVNGSGQSTSSTFASADQNNFIIDSLLWLGGGTIPPPDPPGPIPPNQWFSVVNKNSSKCVDARSAGTANGTAIQQYACNSSLAQGYQFQATDGGYVRINNRGNAAQVIDVSNVSSADNALLHLWAYGGGNNQQWQPVAEDGGYFHFVSRHSGKCLTVPNSSTADSVQLVQLTCNGSAAQSFRLTQQA
ncbi:ThuA domain-containing protein [Kibdelosporangium philippinense]|uniref:ThuA domain-containing protein n=2 Tax=Kibdelosporangium philippinense TaxID=211113 RepID=A0ABS8Z6S1_9PSEU|nr:ThuA domain-containing protein [Kibdelosporangium philippinense]MCE7003576.1 ThuA domain-containing protein [Kibdelosporangium philippinense]